MTSNAPSGSSCRRPPSVDMGRLIAPGTRAAANSSTSRTSMSGTPCRSRSCWTVIDFTRLQYPRQEVPSPLVLRVREHLAGVALLDDDPAVHEDEAVADLAREAHLVRHDEHRHPL